MVHAGNLGNEKAVISAFSLQPTQLRISSIISRSPDGLIVKPRYPEIARIREGSIVIEPCVPNKLL
jgi:septum site-determining protein MinC